MIIHDQEIHIWVADLDSLFDRYTYYNSLLSLEEQYRKEKFAFEILKMRYAISHGVLRLLLQHYLDKPTNSISFSSGSYGKPFLTDNPHHLQFNLSHSHQIAVYGFSQKNDIGVDIEYLEADRVANIENYILSDSEKTIFNTLGIKEKKQALFHTWTRKEAFLKSIGLGLSIPLTTIEVTIDPSLPPKILKINKELGKAEDWFLQNFYINTDYLGALAVKSYYSRVCFFSYINPA